MLVLLSPAKTLDFETELPTKKNSQPRFIDDAQLLVDVMVNMSPADLSGLMGISDELAVLNVRRFADFTTPFTTLNARPAVLAFNGDVYRGLSARTFSERDFTAAQKTLRILSGLYGLLRPLDLIQPYRLEMGIKVATQRGRDLYDWWGERISQQLASDLADTSGAKVIINLASEEYFTAVRPKVLNVPIISPRFEEVRQGGKRKMITLFTKRARGAMAGWIVRNRITSMNAIKNFDVDGYRFDPHESTARVPVFVRDRVHDQG